MLSLKTEISIVKKVNEMQIMQCGPNDKDREIFNFLAYLIRNEMYDDQRMVNKNIVFKFFSFLEISATILIPIPIPAYRDIDMETKHNPEE
jgi:hypothetical protein